MRCWSSGTALDVAECMSIASAQSLSRIPADCAKVGRCIGPRSHLLVVVFVALACTSASSLIGLSTARHGANGRLR